MMKVEFAKEGLFLDGALVLRMVHMPHPDDSHLYLVLAKKESQYVTWLLNTDCPGFGWGRYFASYDEALDDFNRRLWASRDEEIKRVLKTALIGAKHESCKYGYGQDDPDPTFHCCDWNEVVQDIEKVLKGI